MPPDQLLKMIRAQDLTIRAELNPPENIAGWAITFEVKDAPGGTSVLEKTTSAGIAVTDPGRGILSIALARDDTSELSPSRLLAAGKGYVWNLKRTDAGHHLVLAQGSLLLFEEVTA